jgi:tRNA uridine 5-carboxymethylaminomethyl modification enzyme
MIEYDVIVVGAGHAGNEAAHAAAKLGSKVLLVTMNLQTIGQMSCNPAMGGIAKGQIIREIDAMGGMSGIITDLTTLQFRMLNRKKGPAMWSPRAQSDRWRFAEEWRLQLEGNKNVDMLQDMVVGLNEKGGKVVSVVTSLGVEIKCKSVIITSGTFLNGVIHIGEKQLGGGRAGEGSARGVTEVLNEWGFKSGRMKTGTPPRVDGRSLDYSKFEEQKGDENPSRFSFTETSPVLNQMSCFITYTNPTVHGVLREAFELSPLFNGQIESAGPRYCPSVEDKVFRFADKDRHQIFVEPESRNSVEMYVNGFSTSLPQEIQLEAIRHVPGFDKVKFFRPGYAIEYDYFPPTQLKHSLETKVISGLFLAGQINGTTGYEEAGCQGMMAGINANRYVEQKESIVLNRDEAYIGVLIDDLVTRGTEEPYRMFTSRAEYRILLRQDNADERLTPKAHELGLADEGRLKALETKTALVNDSLDVLRKTNLSEKTANIFLEANKESKIKEPQRAYRLLQRPKVGIHDLVEVLDKKVIGNQDVLEQIEIKAKYSGYIERERENANKLTKLEDVKIPEGFNFSKVQGMATEARMKLAEIQPETIGQARRVSGVSPNDISVLLVFIGR